MLKFLLLCLFVLCIIIKVKSTTIHYGEVCENNNGRRVYIELGDKGVITGEDNSNDNNNNLSHNQQLQKSKSYNHCRLELVTCPACIINLKFIFLNISQNCNKYPVANSCNCDHLLIHEPNYEEVSGRRFCGQTNNNSLLFYKTQTHRAEVSYYGNNFLRDTFLVEYSTERNCEVIQGSLGSESKNINGTQGIISTPYFPYFYSSDLSKEYVIRCSINISCRISLVFTDFLIAKVSVIEIFDWNGKRLEVATGMTFRPSTVVSSGPSLTIRFYANAATNRGFKALYSFLSDDEDNKVIVDSNMNCGGLVDSLGGGITMMNLVKEATKFFDCVWILQPSKSFMHFYTHLYLKVIAFSDFENSAELWVHQGVTSSGRRLEILMYPSVNVEDFKINEHVLLISEGLYIRFKGVLRDESKLELSYTAFSHNACITGTDFFCTNQRCIPIYLQCDGFDHCGDNSDEPLSCFQDGKHRRWSHTSNFFFPKNAQYTDLHVAAIVFLICCFGLVSLIVAMIILIFRINNRVHQHRQIESHLQVITDMLEEETSNVQEEIIEDDPPEYEPPPNYEELTNGKLQKRPGNNTEDENNKNFLKRSTCTRCSKRLNSNLKGASANHTAASTSGTSNVPSSPPPNYDELNCSFMQTLTSNIEESASGMKWSKYTINVAENKQSFFSRHFSNDDFNILKKKVLQKSKRRKNRNKTGFSKAWQSNLNICLSDSELPEINYVNGDIEEDNLLKLQRSFSFEI